MATPFTSYPGLTGAQTDFAVPFEYISKSHVLAYVDTVEVSLEFLSDYIVRVSPAPSGDLTILRRTPTDASLVEFTDGSVLIDDELNLSALQSLFVVEEAYVALEAALALDPTDGAYNADSLRIKNVANPTAAGDAVNKLWAETSMTSSVATAITKASEASASAATASAQAVIATTKASEASGSSTTSTTKAGEAAASAVAADASAVSAASNAGTATTKAAEADASADAASGSASSASTSASTATTKASEAAASAASIVGDEASAAASAAAALASENAVAFAAVPVGTVLMQNGAVDPGYIRFGEGGSYDRTVYPDLADWMDANGETAFDLSAGDVAAGVLPDWRDYVPRTAGGALGPAVGATQEDAMQGHKHQFNGGGTASGGTLNNGVAAYLIPWSSTGGTAQTDYQSGPLTDGVNGTPRTASETRVKSFGVRWQIKAYGAFVNEGTADLVAIETAQAQMVRKDAQTLSGSEQLQVHDNLGLGINYNRWKTIQLFDMTAAASVEQTGLGGFSELRVSGHVRSASTGVLLLRVSKNNGASYVSGGTDYLYNFLGSANGLSSCGQGSGAFAYLVVFSFLAGTYAYFDAAVQNFNTSLYEGQINSSNNGINAASQLFVTANQTRFANGAADASNAIQIFHSTGSMTGEIHVEGRQ
jgi:hypothetical protein